MQQNELQIAHIYFNLVKDLIPLYFKCDIYTRVFVCITIHYNGKANNFGIVFTIDHFIFINVCVFTTMQQEQTKRNTMTLPPKTINNSKWTIDKQA